jgi:hypothetical protein
MFGIVYFGVGVSGHMALQRSTIACFFGTFLWDYVMSHFSHIKELIMIKKRIFNSFYTKAHGVNFDFRDFRRIYYLLKVLMF